ncbi:4-sulfomuconolactone hydrolase [Fusarium oxysporum f. sp. albedinis]|nr:4-sulfomuconolactone hydrolase [Fusarium oxysporum f. sp. albedinis]
MANESQPQPIGSGSTSGSPCATAPLRVDFVPTKPRAFVTPMASLYLFRTVDADWFRWHHIPRRYCARSKGSMTPVAPRTKAMTV